MSREKEIKGRIQRIVIVFQNNGRVSDLAESDFSKAIEWITYYWRTKNFLPSFGDSISDNTGERFIVIGKSFFINEYETVEIDVMDEQEFSARIFRSGDFTFKLDK